MTWPEPQAGGTTAGLVFLTNSEGQLAIVVIGADVVVAPNAECVIQQTGGDVDLPIWMLINITSTGIIMFTIFNPSRFRRMERIFRPRCAERELEKMSP